MDCPRCHLPQEELAWACDGCGHEFRRDFEVVRTELRTNIRKSRTVFWAMVLVDLGILAGVIYLAMQGMIYISVPLALAALGATARASHRISVLREHSSSLDRRYVPLPKATLEP